MSRFPIHGWRSRGYIPHLDFSSTIQHLIIGLADALPDFVNDDDPANHLKRFDASLDRGLGRRLLAEPTCAAIVENELLRHDGKRYRLLAWCIMPNHVHVVLEQLQDLAGTVRRWKSWTAREINSATGRRGAVWYREYFDRFARNAGQVERMIWYVEATRSLPDLLARRRTGIGLRRALHEEPGRRPAVPRFDRRRDDLVFTFRSCAS